MDEKCHTIKKIINFSEQTHQNRHYLMNMFTKISILEVVYINLTATRTKSGTSQDFSIENGKKRVHGIKNQAFLLIH